VAVEPAKPAGDAKRPLIPIEAGSADATRSQSKAASTYQYWMNYYRTHDESPEALKEKVTLLNFNRKSADVEAILKGFLRYHPKDAATWMYEALAIAIKMNKGSEGDFKTALGYAADMAVRSQNPNDLVSVADLMLVHHELDRAGSLLDRAAEKVPHRSEPLFMMINLAQQTKDPERMAKGVDALLALGWPGVDEQFRREARNQVETLAKALREEKREAEADALMDRLTQAETRDVYVRMTWTGDAGFTLAVEEPLGATARDITPRTVFGGSIVKGGFGNHPESVYVCPRGFDGDYTVRIETIYNNPAKPALEGTLELITHEGMADEHKETRTIRLTKSPEPVVVHLSGGRRKAAMPYLTPQAAAATPPAAESKSKSKTRTKAEKKPAPAAGAAGGPEVKGRPQ
jgi:hypothetical protein